MLEITIIIAGLNKKVKRKLSNSDFFSLPMSFINQLEAIISKATDDYDKISKNEPLVESSEDGTARGNVLDVIIKQQNAEKKKLWNKLYKVLMTISLRSEVVGNN